MSDKENLERGPAHPVFLKPAGPNLGVAPPRGEAPPRRGMFASLAHRPFRRYWISLFLSNIGTWMQVVAQGWLVLRLSDSRGRSRRSSSRRSPGSPPTAWTAGAS